MNCGMKVQTTISHIVLTSIDELWYELWYEGPKNKNGLYNIMTVLVNLK